MDPVSSPLPFLRKALCDKTKKPTFPCTQPKRNLPLNSIMWASEAMYSTWKQNVVMLNYLLTSRHSCDLGGSSVEGASLSRAEWAELLLLSPLFTREPLGRPAAEACCLQGGNCSHRPSGRICSASSYPPFPSKLVNHPGSFVCVNSTCMGSLFHLGAREAGLGSAVGAAGRLCPSELFLTGAQVLGRWGGWRPWALDQRPQCWQLVLSVFRTAAWKNYGYCFYFPHL